MTEATELLRQIHPSWIQADRPTSQAFRPTKKDNGLLSTDDGDQTTPVAAWTHYTSVRKLESAGILAVTVAEFEAESLTVRADPSPDTPFHVSIDYNGHATGQIEGKSKRLRNIAFARGWRHRVS